MEALLVEPEKYRGHDETRQRATRSNHWPLTEPVRHHDSDPGGRDRADGGGEHETTQRRRPSSRRAVNVRILVHKGKRGQSRRRCVSPIFFRLMPDPNGINARREIRRSLCEALAELAPAKAM